MKHKTHIALVLLLLLNLPRLCAQSDSIRNEMGGKTALSSLGRCKIYVTEGRDRKRCTIREIGTIVMVYEQEGSLHDMPIRNIEKILFENDNQVTLYFDDDNEPILASNQYSWNIPAPPTREFLPQPDEKDTIVRTNGDTIRCRITKETEWSVFYTENNTGKMLSREFIQTIHSPGGWRQVIKEEVSDSTAGNTDTASTHKQETESWNYVAENKPGIKNEILDYEAQGRKDARAYYSGKGAFTGGVVSGIVFPIGWFPAILIAAIPPVNINNPENRNDHLLHTNPEYLKGFKKEAHKKKAGEVLGGFVGGILVDIGILLCL